MKRVVLVGATDGIGRALAAEYARRGWRVGVVGRSAGKVESTVAAAVEAAAAAGIGGPPGSRPGDPTALAPVGAVADVTDAPASRRAFDEIVRALGQLDLLIYCAGVMPPEESGEARTEAAPLLMEVNVVGAVRWIEMAVELAGLGRGRVAALGSVAGDRARKGSPLYGASKAALHQYLEGLRHRLHGTGVGVSTVKPGWVRTRMLGEALADSPATVSAERAARVIADRLDRGAESFYVPRWWGAVSLAVRLIPRWLFKRVAPP